VNISFLLVVVSNDDELCQSEGEEAAGKVSKVVMWYERKRRPSVTLVTSRVPMMPRSILVQTGLLRWRFERGRYVNTYLSLSERRTACVRACRMS
jgi:hypothetical protein